MTERGVINIVFAMHITLFITKLTGGILSGSIAVISDGLQSGIDVFATVAMAFATKINGLPADKYHQFGHTRAQPIAAFLIAILTGVTGIEIIKYGIEKITSPSAIENPTKLIIMMSIMTLFSGIISFLTTRTGKANNNNAMIAMGKETLGDIFISLGAIVGIIGSIKGILWLDPVMAIVIGFGVIKIGFNIAKDNIGLLMGAVADEEQVALIQEIIFNKFPVVIAIHDMHTQKLGTKIYAVIHCEIVDKNYSFKQIHDIEEGIQNELRRLEFIENVTIHLDFKDDSSTGERIVKIKT